MDLYKKIVGLALLLLLFWGCSNEELKSIRLQTPTAHLLTLPVSADTTTVLEVSSSLWLSVWDSIRQEAGISQSDILEAVPLLATATLLTPDSSFAQLTQFDLYTQGSNNERLLLASLPEDATPAGQSLPLFVSPENHLDNFMLEEPSLLLRYQLKTLRDTAWQVSVQVVWEMKGAWD